MLFNLYLWKICLKNWRLPPKSYQQKRPQRDYGYNKITEKKISPFLKFLTYFRGPIPWMIEIAAVLSAITIQVEKRSHFRL